MSLLKHTGISLSDLQTISNFPEKETEESFVLPVEGMDLELPLSKNEQAIISYVAGYVGNSLIRNHVKCTDCESLFITRDCELPPPDYEGDEDLHTEFIQLLTRGKHHQTIFFFFAIVVIPSL